MPAKGGSKKGGKAKKIVEDPRIVKEMRDACYKGDMEELTKFIAQPQAERKWDFAGQAGECLPRASEKGHTETVRCLLDANCDVNALSGKALHKASEYGIMPMIQLLFERDADLNVKSEFTEYTALHFATMHGHLRVCDFLVQHHVDINALTSPINCSVHNGWAPLHFAADFGHLDLVEYLVEVGKARVDVLTDGDKETPLAVAAEHGRFDIVKYLVSAGADLHKTRRGLSVVQWCIYRCDEETVQFLVSFGAKPDLSVKCIWFSNPDKTLGELVQDQLSEPLWEKLDTAIYRGGVKLRERAAHMKLLSEVKWQAVEEEKEKDEYDIETEEPAGPVVLSFPKHVIHLISSYEL